MISTSFFFFLKEVHSRAEVEQKRLFGGNILFLEDVSKFLFFFFTLTLSSCMVIGSFGMFGFRSFPHQAISSYSHRYINMYK